MNDNEILDELDLVRETVMNVIFSITSTIEDVASSIFDYIEEVLEEEIPAG